MTTALSVSSYSVLIVYLLIFVLIWATSLDEHLLFWQPVTVLYIVLLLFNLQGMLSCTVGKIN